MKNKVSIIVPSLNPDEKLMQVVKGLVDAGFKDIILVNDGSDNEHLAPFEQAAEYEQCTVLTHEVNKGKGRALKTAFEYVYKNRKDIEGVITVDGDNQHQIPDIEACGEKMLELKDHVILGCRDFTGDDVPKRSKVGNNITNYVFKYLCGMNISDTQTGLRAIPFEYLSDFAELKGERFEYETNMLLELKELSIPYDEVKINTVYIEENATSHFNPLMDSLKIYKVIIKFMLSSVSSCVLDLVLFTVILALLNFFLGEEAVLFNTGMKVNTIVATVIARVFSSIFNFTMNKKAVFRSKTPIKSTLVRYYVLCLAQLAISAGSVAILEDILGIKFELVTTVIKLVVDGALFLISFPIQRRWVFKK
ncbi:MAG: glycosyltransferase [Lachnospiraceae bacterium]|nr:glycosyltransferase [Lachnospiraceae bacterium]